MYNLPTLLKGLALSIYKFGFKFAILLLFSILFLGCFSHQPQRSNSVLFSFITPDFRISDAGFIHHYANESQIQIYSSGAVILNLKLAQNICINSVCYNRQIFNTKYPIASEPTDNMAIAASPLILAFCPVLSKNIAARMVTGITRIILSAKSKIVATAIAPNATWDKPSPIKEYLFNTNVTPNKDEHSAIKTPTINAYRTKGYSK